MSGKNSVFAILGKSFKIYLRFFHKFFLYMTFPVIGQMVGFVLILSPTIYMQKNLPLLAEKYSFFSDSSRQMALILLVIVPGLILMLSAFWKYLVAYSALNSMTQSAIVSGKIYDFPAHNSFVNRNILKFFLIWFVISILMLLSIHPLLAIICGIIFLFLVPVFQIFTFEQDKSAFECLKRSFELVKNNFGRVTGILALLGLILWIIAEIATWSGVKYLPYEKLFSEYANMILKIPFIQELNLKLSQLAEIGVNFQITSEMISETILSVVIGMLVWGYTLPLRSICWTLWYKSTTDGENRNKKSYKKRNPKQLDPEIIRRANLDDDEEV